jgi:hypothetical protein
MMSQNHSIIVDMNEKGPTTPKPRCFAGLSSSAYLSKGVRDKDAPGVWIDLEKKKMFVRFFNQDEQGILTVANDSGSFFFGESVRPNGVNVFNLTELTAGGRYNVIIKTPDKEYYGYFYYQELLN